MSMELAEVEERVLNVKRKQRLEWNEREMEKSARTMASSLKDIHDNKLYLGEYPTFEDYCVKRWGISRQRGYQIIGAQNTRLMLADAVKDDPGASEALEGMSEGAVRELGKREEPVKILKEVSVKTTKPKIRDVTKPEEPKDLELCPACGRPL